MSKRDWFRDMLGLPRNLGSDETDSYFYERTETTTTTTHPEPRQGGKTEFKAVDGLVVLESGGKQVMRMSLVNAYRALDQLTKAIAEAEKQTDAARIKNGGN